MPLKYDVSMDVAITVEVTIEDDEQVPDDDQERYAEDKAMHYVEMGVPLSMTIGDITITDTRLVAM